MSEDVAVAIREAVEKVVRPLAEENARLKAQLAEAQALRCVADPEACFQADKQLRARVREFEAALENAAREFVYLRTEPGVMTARRLHRIVVAEEAARKALAPAGEESK